MDSQMQNPLQALRRGKSFVLQENLTAVRWPPECVVCGGSAAVTDTLKLVKTFKTLGKINIELPGIPYCQNCAPKIRHGKLLNQATYILAFILGIPIGIAFIVAAASNQQNTFIWCGLLLLIGLAIGYFLAWLLIKLPIKLIFRRSLAEPVDAWLIEEKKQDGKLGLSVMLSIPYPTYADRFAALNGIPEASR